MRQLRVARCRGTIPKANLRLSRLQAPSAHPAPFSRRPDHPLQPAAQVRREGCGVRGLESRRPGIAANGRTPARTVAADAAPWRGLEAAPWRVGGLLQRRERAVSAGLPPPSVNAHVPRGSHPSRAAGISRCPPGSASTSSARRIATTTTTATTPFAHSLNLVGLAIRPGIRRYAAPEMHTHTARHRLGWWFARRRDGGG